MKHSKQRPGISIVRSDMLPRLRRLLDTLGEFKQLAGPIVEFRVVDDADILIGKVL